MSTSKIRVKLSGYDHSLVESALVRIIDIVTKNGAKISGPVPLPTIKEVVTVIRSPHKYKDSREQFEKRTHKRLLDIYNPNQKVVEALTRLEMPAGVEIQIKLTA
ncbi:MAG: 30S ribosomal protein S10 [Firmicutes bacterium]|nr:30S ribosomal protein S10 [Bacillota bacterium]